MKKRPLSIAVLSCLFIAVGCVALVYHLLPQHLGEFHSPGQLMWICGVRALAIVGGAFMWLGYNWARWLLAAWIAFHVVISAFHSLFEMSVHGALFAVIAWFLFRPAAGAFFKGNSETPPDVPERSQV